LNLTDAIRECAVDLLETEDKVTIEHLVDCAELRHPDAFLAARDKLVAEAARRKAKRVLRDLSEDDDDPAQLAIPGLPLPSAIAVPDKTGAYYYVRTDKATWGEVVAGRDVRDRNLQRAQAKLDNYDDALDALRPLMESDPLITVAAAARRLVPR
jgi:hypothetical protein